MATPLLAALAWAVAAMVDPSPLDEAGALLTGTGLIIIALVGVAGMVLTGGRWARRLSLGVVAGGYLLAFIRDLDSGWIAALTLTSFAAAMLFLPAVTGQIRKLPSASGPPPRATLLPLLLITVPFLLGLTSLGNTDPAALVVGFGALGAAFWYARVLPGGLIMVRVLWPLLAVALAWQLGLVAGLLSIAAGLAVAGLAWTSDSSVAFHPPRERGSIVPTPPELAPREVLETADLDDRGRPAS
jgi:hypothetical protein